jgi:hypothetical protein
MSLIKIVNLGDELVFDCRAKREEAKKISVTVVEFLKNFNGKPGVKFKIDADLSIPIRQFRQQTIGDHEDPLNKKI